MHSASFIVLRSNCWLQWQLGLEITFPSSPPIVSTSVLAKISYWLSLGLSRLDSIVPQLTSLVSFVNFFLSSESWFCMSLLLICCLSISFWSSMALMVFFFSSTCKSESDVEMAANYLRTSDTLILSLLAKHSPNALRQLLTSSPFLFPLLLTSSLHLSISIIKISYDLMVKSS